MGRLGSRMGTLCVACVLLFSLGCGPKKDPDLAKADKAAPLALIAPMMGDFDCDGGAGDCGDWYRVTAATPGTLEVTVALAAGQGIGTPLVITLADGKQLPVAETQSNGRQRFGARVAVTPGDYFAWLHAEGSTRGKLSYQIQAEVKQGELGDLGTDVDVTAPRLCLRVQASPKANFYGGQPHVVRLLILPLTSALAFEQASEDSLLSGAKPQGAAGEPIVARVVPGETRTLVDPVPSNTRSLGVVADYYRAPGSFDRLPQADRPGELLGRLARSVPRRERTATAMSDLQRALGLAACALSLALLGCPTVPAAAPPPAPVQPPPPPPPPDPDGTPTQPSPLAFGALHGDSLDRAARDSDDWYLLNVREPGTLRVAVEGAGGAALTNVLVALTDAKNAASVQPIRTGGRTRLELPAQTVAAGPRLLWVGLEPEATAAVAYQVRATFTARKAPAPAPKPPPPPAFNVFTTRVVEFATAQGATQFATIEGGQNAGITAGMRGRLVEAGRVIATFEVVEVYQRGSRVRLADRVERVTAQTQAEVDVPSCPESEVRRDRPPIHPRRLRCAPCGVGFSYASVARLAGGAARRPRSCGVLLTRTGGPRGEPLGDTPGPRRATPVRARVHDRAAQFRGSRARIIANGQEDREMGLLDGLFGSKKKPTRRGGGDADDTDSSHYTRVIPREPEAAPPPQAPSWGDEPVAAPEPPPAPRYEAPRPAPVYSPPPPPPPAPRAPTPVPRAVPEDDGATVIGAVPKLGTAKFVALLVCVDGPIEGHICRIYPGENVIGRQGRPDSERLPDHARTISREHVRLTAEDGYFVIQPIRAENATFVNDVPVETHETLQDKDRVTLGATKPSTFVLLVVP